MINNKDKKSLFKSLYLEIIGVVGIYPNLLVHCVYTINKKRVMDIIQFHIGSDNIKVNSQYLSLEKDKNNYIILNYILQKARPYASETLKIFQNKIEKK